MRGEKITEKTLFVLFVCFFIVTAILHAQEIKMKATFKALPDRNIEVSGSTSASGLLPKGQMNVSNDIGISIEYLEKGGKFRRLPSHLALRGPSNYRIGKHFLTRDEERGVKSHILSVYGVRLDNKKDDGRSFSFKKIVRLPEKADTFRITGTLKHYWSGTWPAIAYKHETAGPFPIKNTKFPPKGPCKDDKLNRDRDGDGVLDWNDLCPDKKGIKGGLLGCPDANLKFKNLLNQAEAYYRKEVRDFLKCAGIKGANYHAVQLNFKYTGNTQYDQNVIELPSPEHWLAYWLADREMKCKGKIEKIPKDDYYIFTSLYHEVGHYIAEIIGMEDVSGSSGKHETWVRSNPGLAFDEGRADLIMLMMAKKKGIVDIKTKWKHSISGDYGSTAAKTKFTKKPEPGAGMTTEGAVTSIMQETLPSDPCKALRKFVDVHNEWKKYTDGQPQNLRDWMIGYNLLMKRKAKSIDEMIDIDKKTIKILEKYKITPAGFGYVYNVKNLDGIRIYDVHKDPDAAKQDEFIKFIGLKNMPNLIRVGHVDMAIDAMKGAVLGITAKSEYEVEINEKGEIKVTVFKDSVVITQPDGKKSNVAAGRSFHWPRKETAFSGNMADALGMPCAKTDMEFAVWLNRCLWEEEPDMNGLRYRFEVEKIKLDRKQTIIDYFTAPSYAELNKSDREFIRDVYQAILGREPRPIEQHTWMERLRLRVSRESIVRGFLKSPEYKELIANCP